MGRKKKEVKVITKPEHDAKLAVIKGERTIKEREEELTLYSDGQPYDKVRVIGETKFYLSGAVSAIFEVGKRLIWIKEKEAHGEFGRIVAEEFGLALRSASRFMAVARKMVKSANLADLGKSKVYALLDVPDEDLNDFEGSGTILGKPLDEVEKMSVRELRDLVRGHRDRKKTWEEKLEKEKEQNRRKDQVIEALQLGFPPEEEAAMKQMGEIKKEAISIYNFLLGAKVEGQVSDKWILEFLSLTWFLADLFKFLALAKDLAINHLDPIPCSALNEQEKLIWKKYPEVLNYKEPPIITESRKSKEAYEDHQRKFGPQPPPQVPTGISKEELRKGN